MIGLVLFAAVAAQPPRAPQAKGEAAREQLCVAPVAGSAGKRRAYCLKGLELVRPKKPNDAQRVVPGLY
jgi:hypothetical protein